MHIYAHIRTYMFFLIFPTYERHLKKSFFAHPLAAQLEDCNTPSSVLAVLHEQVKQLDRSHDRLRLTKCLGPTVNVLHSLSETLGAGVALVCSMT